MQTMICCISKGHKVYESIRMGIGQGPPMHTLHIFERKWTLSLRFCNVSDDPRVKKKVIIYEAVWTLLQMWRHLRAGQARQVGGTISPY